MEMDLNLFGLMGTRKLAVARKHRSWGQWRAVANSLFARLATESLGGATDKRI